MEEAQTHIGGIYARKTPKSAGLHEPKSRQRSLTQRRLLLSAVTQTSGTAVIDAT
jgi:hypothetical protein